MNYTASCISASGQYQMVTTFTQGVFFSVDFGANWVTSGSSGFDSGSVLSKTYNYTSCSMSASGQYQLVNSYTNGVFLSSNFGASYTLITNTLSLNSAYTSNASFLLGEIVCKNSD